MKKEIENLNFESIPDATFSGEEIEPSLVIEGENGYFLVKDTDYTVEFANNVNVGTATVTVTGIGNYKGTKELTFKIVKAEHDMGYNSWDGTYNYDGQPHGIQIIYGGTIKYANDNDEYVLDEMPQYIEPGTYIIKYMLIQDDNHEVAYGSNKVIINKIPLCVNTSWTQVIFDNKEHTPDITINICDSNEELSSDLYTITYKYGTGGGPNGAENSAEYPFTEIIPETDSSTLPSFTQPGYYYIKFHIESDYYATVDGTMYMIVEGIMGYNKEKIKIKDNYMIFNNITDDTGLLFDFALKTGSTAGYISNGGNVFQTGADYEIRFNNQLDESNYSIHYTSVILGDVNGDGDITPLDYVRIKNHIMETSIIKNGAQKIAADYNEDNQISPLDYVKVKNYIMNGGN